MTDKPTGEAGLTGGASPKSPPRTTRYNWEGGDLPIWLLLRRYWHTYSLSIVNGEQAVTRTTRIELSPDAARRLVNNLTLALKHNGHWKEPT